MLLKDCGAGTSEVCRAGQQAGNSGKLSVTVTRQNCVSSGETQFSLIRTSSGWMRSPRLRKNNPLTQSRLTACSPHLPSTRTGTSSLASAQTAGRHGLSTLAHRLTLRAGCGKAASGRGRPGTLAGTLTGTLPGSRPPSGGARASRAADRAAVV